MKEIERYTWPNGLRLVHKRVESPVAHCGIIINTGSRDERKNEHGIAHLAEHLLFKGTKKRKAFHILSRMEDVGGEINAYTTKEETCVYTSFFNTYYDRALELISDIVFHSVFPEKELEKEKEIIIDEINSYRDSPSELIFDEFDELAFAGNSIGRNILGEEKKLKQITRPQLVDFVKRNYVPGKIVISSVGNISFDKLLKQVNKYFSDIPATHQKNQRKFAYSYTPFNKSVKKNTHQAHCIIGNMAYDTNDEKRYSLFLLNNLLGGPGLNSRLNMSLREKNGYAYNVDSSYNAYRDTGIICIYFGTDSTDLNRSIKTILRELDKLKVKRLGQYQLLKAKKQLIGQIAISAENNENVMLSNGKSIQVFDRVYSLAETTQKVESITAYQIQEVANEIFKTENLSYLVYF